MDKTTIEGEEEEEEEEEKKSGPKQPNNSQGVDNKDDEMESLGKDLERLDISTSKEDKYREAFWNQTKSGWEKQFVTSYKGVFENDQSNTMIKNNELEALLEQNLPFKIPTHQELMQGAERDGNRDEAEKMFREFSKGEKAEELLRMLGYGEEQSKNKFADFADEHEPAVLEAMSLVFKLQFNKRLEGGETSENDVQLVYDTLVRNIMWQIGLWYPVGDFSRNLTHKTAVGKGVSGSGMSSASARPDAQVNLVKGEGEKKFAREVFLLEEKSNSIEFPKAIEDFEDPERYSFCAAKYGDLPFILGVAAAGTNLQWVKIRPRTYDDIICDKNGRLLMEFDRKPGKAYANQAYHSVVVETIGKCFNVLNMKDRFTIARYAVNTHFLLLQMRHLLPEEPVEIRLRGRPSETLYDPNVERGYFKKFEKSFQISLGELQELYALIDSKWSSDNIDHREEVKHIVRHTREIFRRKTKKEKEEEKKKQGEEEEEAKKAVGQDLFQIEKSRPDPVGDRVVISTWPLGYQRAPNSLKEVKDAIYAVLHALKLMHSHRFVHRDLRWPNVARLSDGNWILIDLEKSRQIDNDWPERVELDSVHWPIEDKKNHPEHWEPKHDLKMVREMLEPRYTNPTHFLDKACVVRPKFNELLDYLDESEPNASYALDLLGNIVLS